MEYSVKVFKEGNVTGHKVEEGTNLLKFLRDHSYAPSAPCGGQGTCGKCRVKVAGIPYEASEKESRLLGENALSKGHRLACYNAVENNLEIYLDGPLEKAKIITEGRKRQSSPQPAVCKKVVVLKAPNLEDQRSDYERLLEHLEEEGFDCDLEVLRQIPHILRMQNYTVTLVLFDGRLIGVEAGDTTDVMLGLAVDIGTTTIAAYLIDLLTGREMGVYSCLNPQRKFGADVISRIQYTNESREKRDEMHSTIIACMNDIVRYFEATNNIRKGDIYTAVFVGNTTMMHFLMNLPAGNIAASPFIPVTTRLHSYPARELGMDISFFGVSVFAPCVAAYIGADTVGAVVSGGMNEEENVLLLVDIGTNGEIVLGNKERMYCCSVAAGPAFEGAHIRNGVGGILGAIDKISLERGVKFTTIGGDKPVGICGSGIVDAVAAMLSRGVMDEMGRILEEDEMDEATAKEFGAKIFELDGITSFLIAKREECNGETDIVITQRDIREIQNAKAAIAAGIKILAKESGIQLEDVKKVYLAGGFGSYISIESALKIGLLPKALRGKVESIGNAAGAGAIEMLMSSKIMKKASEIKETFRYIELSASKEFVEEYIKSMSFEN